MLLVLFLSDFIYFACSYLTLVLCIWHKWLSWITKGTCTKYRHTYGPYRFGASRYTYCKCALSVSTVEGPSICWINSAIVEPACLNFTLSQTTTSDLQTVLVYELSVTYMHHLHCLLCVTELKPPHFSFSSTMNFWMEFVFFKLSILPMTQLF